MFPYCLAGTKTSDELFPQDEKYSVLRFSSRKEERSCETAAVEVLSVNGHTSSLLVPSTCRLKSTIHFPVIDLRNEKVNLRNHEAFNDIFA